MRRKKILFLSCLLFFCSLGYGQFNHLIFRHFNRANGLPVDEVTCLAQDSSGFIWIGSKEGLFRFDGFTYKEFYSNPSRPASLPNNYISTIYVDGKGLLWVGTLGGIALLQNDGQVLDVVNSGNNSAFSKFSDNVADIKIHAGKVWVSTGESLFSMALYNKKISGIRKHDFKKEYAYSTNALGPIEFDSHGRLWVCTLDGLVIFDPSKNTLQHKKNNPSSLLVLNESYAFKSIYLDNNAQKLVYAHWQPSVKLYDITTGEITVYSGNTNGQPAYEKLVHAYLKDRSGRLWMATGEGLKTTKSLDGKIEQTITHHTNNPYSPVYPEITSLLQDRDGLLWVGTRKGISVTDPYRSAITNISAHNSDVYPFGKWPVNAIIQIDTSTLLVGTQNGDGLYETDLSLLPKKHYQWNNMKYDWTWSFCRYGSSVYIAAQGGTLLYDTPKKTIQKLTGKPFDKFYPVSSFVPAGDTAIWMSKYFDGFMCYYPSANKFKTFSLSALGEEAAILHLAPDTDSTLWLIHNNKGLLRFHKKKEKIIERLLPGKDGLLQSQIMFVRNAGEYLLIGYVSKGISLYHKNTKTFRHFSQAEGLVSNTLNDAYINLPFAWISSTNGISRFDLNKKTFTNYDYSTGILENDFNCITQLNDGRIIAGNTKGLIYFHTEQPQNIQALYPPILTEVSVEGNSLAADAFRNGKTISIPYNENDFSFEYISLGYSNHRQVEYAYKLDGIDKDWVMAGSRRFASYANLQGGNYNLRIKARLPGSAWVESNQPLHLFVGTAFYKQWWFYLLCALLIASLIYLFFRYRLQQLLLLEKMRSDISTDLHDEVGATLSSISLFSEMARQSAPDGEKREQYLKRIGERSRESIEKMSDIVWSIHPGNDSLQEMLTRMKTHVNELFEDSQTHIHWQEEGAVENLKFNMQQRKNLYLLFKEAIANAAKYAAAKNIYIHLITSSKELQLSIKDDGKGFDDNRVKYGNGIKNMKQRAAHLQGFLIIQSSETKGTSIVLKLRY